jgi:hypothetical protein
MDKLTNDQAAKLAQLSVKQQTSAAEIQRIMLEMQLRQWCVEQAVAAQGDAPLFIGEGELGKPTKVHFATVDIADRIYQFVTTPLREQQ